MYNCILCIFKKGLIDNMGIFGSRDKRRQNDEDDESLLRRKETKGRISTKYNVSRNKGYKEKLFWK